MYVVKVVGDLCQLLWQPECCAELGAVLLIVQKLRILYIQTYTEVRYFNAGPGSDGLNCIM